MRFLIISDAWYPQINGVVRTYEHLAQELQAQGHIVRVIGPECFLNFALPSYNEIDLSLFPARKLRRIIDMFAPDHIHIAVEGPLGLAARRICHQKNMDYTTCYHSHFPDYVAKRCRWLGARFAGWMRQRVISYVRWFHKNSKAVFVATPSLEQTLQEWGFTAPMKRLLRGVDTNIFYPPHNEAPEAPQNPTSEALHPPAPRPSTAKPTLLYVGRVAVEKNIEDFLGLDIDAHKVVVGGGPDLPRLKDAYPDAVFLGYKTGAELAACYRKADVFVFPSKTDTFGIVLIEALACGLPVAAYPVTGPIDIITETALGTLNDDLSAAVKDALAKTDAAAAAQRAQHTRDIYSWEAVAAAFLDAIKHINDTQGQTMAYTDEAPQQRDLSAPWQNTKAVPLGD